MNTPRHGRHLPIDIDKHEILHSPSSINTLLINALLIHFQGTFVISKTK